MICLGIQETCFLSGDYYHNMSEVFPKKFGEHFFAIIKAYLKAMLESKTEEEWTSAYSQAKQRICFRPDKVELLNGICTQHKWQATKYCDHIRLSKSSHESVKGNLD
jgi:hypothetical protein